MSTVNPTRAEESACTRELHEAMQEARLFSDLSQSGATVLVSDAYANLREVYAALERVSRRVDAERAARQELILLLADATTDHNLGRTLEGFVNTLEVE